MSCDTDGWKPLMKAWRRREEKWLKLQREIQSTEPPEMDLTGDTKEIWTMFLSLSAAEQQEFLRQLSEHLKQKPKQQDPWATSQIHQ